MLSSCSQLSKEEPRCGLAAAFMAGSIFPLSAAYYWVEPIGANSGLQGIRGLKKSKGRSEEQPLSQ